MGTTQHDGGEASDFHAWLNAGHNPSCFDLEEEMAELAESFVDCDFIPDWLMEAARYIKGCPLCAKTLEDVTKSMGGELPQAWHNLKSADWENEVT